MGSTTQPVKTLVVVSVVALKERSEKIIPGDVTRVISPWTWRLQMINKEPQTWGVEFKRRRHGGSNEKMVVCRFWMLKHTT